VSAIPFASFLLVAIGLLLALGRWLRVPHSLVLFAGGLLSTLLPLPMPAVRVDSHVITSLLLPPLLHAGAAAVSVDLLRFALLRGVLAGMVQVVLIALAATALARALLPGLDPVGALLLGIAASLGDTRLLNETGQQKHLPRALTDGFVGQGLGKPVVAVTLFTLMVGTIGQPPPAPGAALGHFALDLFGGSALGFAVGFIMAEIRRRTQPATTDVALSVATPFAAALTAEASGLPVVAVVIPAALTMSWRSVDRCTGQAVSSPDARLIERHVWAEAGIMLSAALFFLMGRTLPTALDGLGQGEPARALLLALTLVLVALLLQTGFAWVMLLLPGTPEVPGRGGGRASRWRAAVVAGLASSRSVIALAIVLGMPAGLPGGEPYPGRDLVVAVTAASVVFAVLLHWMALPWAVRWERLGGTEETAKERRLAAAAARNAQDMAPGPEAGAARGLQALAALRAEDRIGDSVRQTAEEEVELRARARQTDARGA